MPALKPLTREQIRSVDQLAIQRLGISGVVLMENAGVNATRSILSFLGGLPRFAHETGLGSIGILCGGGNNGGDGYVIARQLALAGVQVTAYALAAPATLTGDARINADIVSKLGIKIVTASTPDELSLAVAAWHSHSCLIDALLGTGFRGVVRPHLASAIGAANAIHRQSNIPVIAIDLPSGLDCDTGQPSPNSTIEADLTITFVAEKIGFGSESARPFLGRVVAEPIGIPDAWIAATLGL